MAKFGRPQVAFLRIDNHDYPIYEGVNTIGRNKDAVVNIKNIAVSQNHAILAVIENKHYLSDIGSSNLTYHNGIKLIPFLTCQLTSQSKIKFGNVNAAYHILNDSLVIPNDSSRLEMTQDMTQGFYSADTQEFNDVIHFDATQKIDINVVIHEAATQQINLQGFKLPGKPAPRKSNDSQTQSFDIHDAATQVFDIASTSKPNNTPLVAKTNSSSCKEDEDLTQPLSLTTTEKIAEMNAQSNVHEECTQVFDLTAQRITPENNQCGSIHDDCTQLIDLKKPTKTENNSDSATLPLSFETRTKITQITNNHETQETQYSEELSFDIHENYMDDTIEMQNNASGGNLNYFDKHEADKIATQKLDINNSTQKTDKLDNESTQNNNEYVLHNSIDIENTLNKEETEKNSTVEVTNVIQEPPISDTQATNISKTSDLEQENNATNCEDNLNTSQQKENLTQTSFDSMDLLAMDITLGTKQDESSFKVVELNPLYSQSLKSKYSESDSDDEVIKPRKRKPIKIQDSQDVNSDSDTDSEIIIKTKKSARPLQDTQETESHENSRDSDIVKELKLIDPTLNEQNNCDADCIDIKLKRNSTARNLTPTQISQIKNTKNDSDTDCSDIEVRKNSPAKPLKPTQVSQECAQESYAIEDADSDEDTSKSFSKRKLSLVDTTIPETQMSFNNSDYIPATQDIFPSKKNSASSDKSESFKLVLSQTEKSEKFHTSQTPCCSKDLEKKVQRDSELFGHILQRDSLLFKDNFVEADDFHLASTKKLNTGINDSKKTIVIEKRSKSPEDDDLLFEIVSQLAKTKTSCKEKSSSQKSTVSESMEPLHLSENTEKIISRKIDKPNTDCNALEDDFYFASTQKITDSIQSNTTNETNNSLYIQATQKLTEDGPVQKNISEKMDDIYFQATQQLSENKNESKCSETRKHVSENIDDTCNSIYLQATQQLFEKKENEFPLFTQNLCENTQKLPSIEEDISELSTKNGSHKSENILNSDKKFAFKKNAINLDASLNSCLKPNTPKPLEGPKVDTCCKEPFKTDKDDLKEMPAFKNLLDNFESEIETGEIYSMEVRLETQLKLNSDNIERPSNPISSVLENDASSYKKSMSKFKAGNLSLNHLEDLKGFAKSVEEFKEVLVDKTPCVGNRKECQNVTKIKEKDLAALEKLESQNQKLVEELLKTEEETAKKVIENTANVEKVNKSSNKKSVKEENITRRTSQRGLSTLPNRSIASERDGSNYEDDSDMMKIPKRQSVMEDPIKPKQKKSTKSIKTASLCDEALHSNEESTKDESSDNSKLKTDKKPLKLATRKMTRRKGSTSSNTSKASKVSDTSDGEEVTSQKSSKRGLIMEDPIKVTGKKSTKSIKPACCDDVFHPNEESTKDESSDNSKSKTDKKPPARKMIRRRGSTSSNKSKCSEVSGTSAREEAINKKDLKRLESVEESPVTTKRTARRRKLSSSTDNNHNQEETGGGNLSTQPEKKVVRRGQPRKNILSDEDLNSVVLPLLSEVNDSTNKTVNSTLFNSTVNQSVNQSIGYAMNQSLALLDARKTTSKKSSSKAPVTDKNQKLLSEDLQLKAPVNRRSMNLVAEKEAVSDIKTHVNLAKINETMENKTSRRGRPSTKPAIQEIMAVSKESTSTQRQKVDRKPDASLIPPIKNEKIETKAVSRGRKKAATKRAAESGSNISDSGSVSGDSVLSTPKKQKLQRNDSVLSNTAERNLRRQKPKVVFTMLESPKLESMIRKLGGSIVEKVDSCSVLVTEHVKRSQKLLAAVGQAKPICSPSWINESMKQHEFLDPWDHILVDEEAEKKWQFSLKESLQRSSAKKILQDYTFQIMVNNAVDVLKGAIDACGGKCLTRLPSNNTPNLYIIASAENKSKYQKIVKQNPGVKVIEAEAIFDGVLRQELRFEKHYLT